MKNPVVSTNDQTDANQHKPLQDEINAEIVALLFKKSLSSNLTAAFIAALAVFLQAEKSSTWNTITWLTLLFGA